MINFSDAVVNTRQPKLFQDIYKILSRSEKSSRYTSDAIHQHTLDDIEEVQQTTYDYILAERLASGDNVITLDTARKNVALDVERITKDSFFNPMSKIGTMQDPSSYSQATIPVAMSPFESTSTYSSGGLAEIIINKKAKGILINGYSFSTDDKKFWTEEKLIAIHENAEKHNFQDKMADAFRDGLLYGGSVLYPVFKKDFHTTDSFALNFEQLLRKGILDKGAIDYWSETDRWNTVLVPNYNMTASDYMSAKSYYVPLSGIEINTERSAIIKPKRLPYWGAIRNLGWGVTDFEGYIRSILGYEMSIASIPLMAQQMSLLVYEVPLDSLLGTIGLNDTKKLIKDNEEEMKDWSMANPKMLNSLGKISTVNRTYTGYSELMLTMRQDIAAQSGIPESVLFYTQPKGFSNNTEEVLLKESQTTKLSQQAILPSLEQIKNILVIDTFGINSEEAMNCKAVHFSFDNPVVATESERAETASRFMAAVNSAKQAGIPTPAAINIVKQFFKSVNISKEDMDKITGAYDTETRANEIAVNASANRTPEND